MYHRYRVVICSAVHIHPQDTDLSETTILTDSIITFPSNAILQDRVLTVYSHFEAYRRRVCRGSVFRIAVKHVTCTLPFKGSQCHSTLQLR